MVKKVLSYAFFLIPLAVALYFLSSSGWVILRNLNESNIENAQITHLTVIPAKGRYAIRANYFFYVDGNKREGEQIFSKTFLHPSYAKLEAEKKALEVKNVYYSSSVVHWSCLEKKWPIKGVIYGFLSLGIWGYFFTLQKKIISS